MHITVHLKTTSQENSTETKKNDSSVKAREESYEFLHHPIAGQARLGNSIRGSEKNNSSENGGSSIHIPSSYSLNGLSFNSVPAFLFPQKQFDDIQEFETEEFLEKEKKSVPQALSISKVLSTLPGVQRKCSNCGTLMYLSDEPFSGNMAERKCASCEAEEQKILQRKETGNSDVVLSDAVTEALQSSGQPLNPSTKAFMEKRFDYNFSNGNIHNNALVNNSFNDIQLQRNLNLNSPGDIYEQEADAVADKIMRMTDADTVQTKSSPVNIIQRKCAKCGKEQEIEEREDEEKIGNGENAGTELRIHRKCAKCKEDEEENLRRKESHNSVPSVSPAVHRALQSPGKALETGTRTFMEKRFGFDFGKVRIHNDSIAQQSAKDINALAYTYHNNIAFGAGYYQPQTESGKHLIAHELTHVVQQQHADNQQGEKTSFEAINNDKITEHIRIIAQKDKPFNSTGHPMDNDLQVFMEKRFDHNFSSVRLHTDAPAAKIANQLGAVAFTIGQNIFFNNRVYQPNTLDGVHLIAHELTHVVQQSSVSISKEETLSVDSENSVLELEAKRISDLVLTTETLPNITPVSSATINRSTGWAILGGIIGGIAGGLLGALAGPAGAVIGAIGGAALGAWIGGASTNNKKDDKTKSPGLRITELLSRSVTDWVITEEEALQALEILREVEKRNPIELFEIAKLMKFSGRWETLYKKLSPGDRLGLQYFDIYALNPDRGYIMPYDRIHLEFYTPTRFRYDQTGTEPRKRESSLELLSTDYDVDKTGINLPFEIGEIPIAGKSLQDAATIIAKALTNPLWAYEMSVELQPLKRGSAYIGFGEVFAPETVRAGAVTVDKSALALRDKRIKFSEHVRIEMASIGGRVGMAVNIYYREVYEHLDKHEDPEVLWKWAQAEADRRMTEFEKKTPSQEFLEFGKNMLAFASKMPPKELARTRETYSRFMEWLYKNEDNPRLAHYKPVDIWVKAYLNIFQEEVDKDVQKSMEVLKQKRRDESWQKAEVKFGEVIEFMKATIYPGTRTEYVESHQEEISETTGEVVTPGWLIMESPEEKFMRDKIASDFLHHMLETMSKDPENFIKTTVKNDFEKYLRSNPDQFAALSLTMSHPYVERHEDKVDISGWSIALEVVVGFIPLVGTGVGIYEIVAGKDLSGHPLSTTDKTILGVGILLPGIFKTVKAGRGAFKASAVVREYGLLGAEADRVYNAYMKLGPGTTGAKLFTRGFDEIKAGRAVEDPKVLKQMEDVLKDMGMTERESAKALMPAVERQVERAAIEEVSQVKAIVGPISEETETMLKNNPELREALRGNSLAAIVLKKCNTPCIPEQATAGQVKELEGLLRQIKRTGAYDEEALRTFLYHRRSELDSAIGEIKVFTGSKRLQGGTASKDLNAWLEFRNSNGVVTKGIDPALLKARRYLAHDIGVEGGRAQAGLDGLTMSGYDPGIKTGSHGQGFDDIAIHGKDWDKDVIYILEHKGGGSSLAPGQMDLDWVVGNIQRLYREGGQEGKKWAARLAKALEDGRLKGRAYSTKVVKDAAGVTQNIGDWAYTKTKVKLE